jgi:hypothetical protein
MYGSLEKQLEYFVKNHGFEAFGSDHEKLARLYDIRDRRNLIVHNNGRASVEYAEKNGLVPAVKIVSEVLDAKSDRALLREFGASVIDHMAARFSSGSDA